MSRDNLAAEICSVRPFGGSASPVVAYRRPPGDTIIKPAVVPRAQPMQSTQGAVSTAGHSRATRHADDGDGEGDADPPPIKKPPMRETSAPSSKFSQQKQNVRKFSAASTATEAQRERILEALERRPHTTHDLLTLGVFRPGARIRELREMGHDIVTERVTLVDEWGYTHDRCAQYSMGGA